MCFFCSDQGAGDVGDTLSSQAHQSRHEAGAQLWMCSLGSQATDNLFFLMKVTHTLYMKSLKYRKAEIGNKTLSPTTEVLSRLPLCIIKKKKSMAFSMPA